MGSARFRVEGFRVYALYDSGLRGRRVGGGGGGGERLIKDLKRKANSLSRDCKEEEEEEERSLINRS